MSNSYERLLRIADEMGMSNRVLQDEPRRRWLESLIFTPWSAPRYAKLSNVNRPLLCLTDEVGNRKAAEPASWGGSCSQGFVSDERFARFGDKVIKRTNRSVQRSRARR